ncbi:DUF2510 domain-containing protein [Amycolatopsis sp. VS8301801F10]|uniref:DUF2510 domain-containing protein n=1 Tax=unclassified Amycolatopsis TaxID=2618356 RepID=UPI0038FC49D4
MAGHPRQLLASLDVVHAFEPCRPAVAQYLVLGLVIIAALAILAGVPILIVVMVKRSNRRAAAAQLAAAHSPGWYPSPQQPGQLQWWNGTGWTDSFAPATAK